MCGLVTAWIPCLSYVPLCLFPPGVRFRSCTSSSSTSCAMALTVEGTSPGLNSPFVCSANSRATIAAVSPDLIYRKREREMYVGILILFSLSLDGRISGWTNGFIDLWFSLFSDLLSVVQRKPFHITVKLQSSSHFTHTCTLTAHLHTHMQHYF